VSSAGGALGEALWRAGRPIIRAPLLIYDPVFQLAEAGGLAAPLAGAVAFVLTFTVMGGLVVVIGYAILSVIPGADGLRDGVNAWLR
ncbi:MAG: hypothetical protein ABEJ00_03335, partial [Gemmatimonadota bacterium]